MKFIAKTTMYNDNNKNTSGAWLIKGKEYDVLISECGLCFIYNEKGTQCIFPEKDLSELFEIIPDKPKLCEILGVETNELFKLKTAGGDIPLPFKYYIADDGSFLNENDFNSPSIGVDTINGKFKIVKLPKYTEEQKEIFKALKVLGFNYIARDKQENALVAHQEKPTKLSNCHYWGMNDDSRVSELDINLFPFITWNDDEPFEIPEV